MTDKDLIGHLAFRLEKTPRDATAQLDWDVTDRLIKLARLGLWAREHWIPIVMDLRREYSSVPWDIDMVRTEAALAALPKEPAAYLEAKEKK